MIMMFVIVIVIVIAMAVVVMLMAMVVGDAVGKTVLDLVSALPAVLMIMIAAAVPAGGHGFDGDVMVVVMVSAADRS